jgi:hypothetical protein
MKPHDAVKSAITALQAEPELSVEAAVRLAKDNMKADLQIYRDDLVNAALRKKVTDALGRIVARIPPDKARQRNLFDDSPYIPIKIKQDDGDDVYKNLSDLRLSELDQISKDQPFRKKRPKQHPLATLIKRLRPLIQKNPDMTVSEALQSF